MQRTDAQVIADHQRRIETRKALERIVRKGGVRLKKGIHCEAFEAGVARPNPRVERFRADHARQQK